MRIAVIILSLFAGLVMLDLTVVPMRLSVLITSGERPHEAVGSVALFALFALATALIYPYPGVACWLFALAGGAGLYDGVSYSIEEFTLWGLVAVGLAALTSVARREKRAADQVAWARAQHELAVHTALRSLHETVPELLARSPDIDECVPCVGGLVELRPVPPGLHDAARRYGRLLLRLIRPSVRLPR